MNPSQVQTGQAPRDRDLDRCFAELKSRNDDIRHKAAEDLRQILETQQREAITPEHAQDVQRNIFQRVSGSVVNGNSETAEKIGGIYAISALVELKGDDAGQKTARFANALRQVLRSSDTAAMVVAAKAMGKLATPGNPHTSELVDSEVMTALESLQIDRNEGRRFAAVLTIRELAENAPTILFAYIHQIMEVIWVALRDPKVLIRESTAEALSQLLDIISAREAALKDKWYGRTYTEIQRGFQMNSVDTIHGSLLALKELLLKAGMFMQSGMRYQDICEKVYSYKDSKEPLLRREVITLIPSLAGYNPAEFSHKYLHKFMIHLQGQLKREKDRNPAFLAIGKVAQAVGRSIDPYLDGILVFIREGLGIKAQNKAYDDAPIFACISMIALSVGQTMTKYMDALLDPIFECGLSEPMTQALVDMAHYIPPARQAIQEKLLNLLSVVLSGKPFTQLGGPDYRHALANITRLPQDETGRLDTDFELALALQTLGGFDFSGYILNDFVHDVAIQYVENEHPAIRKAAALSSCQLIVKDPIIHQSSRHATSIVGHILERLLAVAVADPDSDIRNAVLRTLDSRFDNHMAKAQRIRTLFIALNDETFANRQAAMVIIGRLSSVNPAYVFPSLRKVLVQLLTEVEYSNTPRSKQQSAQLISDLVNSSSRLIKPYVDPIVNVLLPKTNDVDENVAATALKAIGDLATIGGEEMSKYIPELMPIIIKNLQNLGSLAKRSASLKTLGQLASNAGYVIEPYLEHPELLPILINIIKIEPAGPLRSETIRLIGTLGALDPYKHQQVAEYAPQNNLNAEAQAVDDLSLIMEGLTPSNDDYYPTIVIHTLMGLLKDQSLTGLHQQVIDSVMNIYTSMGLKCVPYLSQVIPGFLSVINMSVSPSRTEGYFSNLSNLVKIVRQHIRPFLPDVLETVQTFWTIAPQARPTMLSLIEAISRSLEGEFKIYLARVLPLMLSVLDEDDTPKRAPSERVLHAFLIFGSSAEEYMHLIIPVIVRMFEKRGQPQPIRKTAIETLGKLSRNVNISEFAAKIIHPLVRVLAGPDNSLKPTALETISALVFQLGPDFIPFIPTVNKVLVSGRIPHHNYAVIVSKLQKGEPLPQSLSPDEHYVDSQDDQKPTEISTKQLAVNQEHLKSAWEAHTRSTKDDWLEWHRRLSIELLKESPQQTLRACFPLASMHPPTSRALFNSAFVSCYTHLFPQYQDELVKSIEAALSSPNIPPEIMLILLNTCEFMEHEDNPLAIDVRELGQYSGRCHAYAKSLHYKELQFNQEQTPEVVEALISINNNLHQYDAAIGILQRAKSFADVEMRETWFEKLGKWDEALAGYQIREAEEPDSIQVTMGKMRCLHALGEWDVLASLADDKWGRALLGGQARGMAPLAAAAAWGMGQWEMMDKYLDAMKAEAPDRSFFGAILSIHRDQFADAQMHIDRARNGLDTELGTLFGESYDRAYTVVVRVQMLAELEEIITYKQSTRDPDRQAMMRDTWSKRLRGCQRNVETWQRMLKVRALVVKPQDNQDMLIKFANLCRKSQRYGLAEKTLRSLVTTDEDIHDMTFDASTSDQVNFAILKYMWSSPSGDRDRALVDLKDFIGRLTNNLEDKSRMLTIEQSPQDQMNGVNGINGAMNSFDTSNSMENLASAHAASKQIDDWRKLLARCHLRRGQWQTALNRGNWNHDRVDDILESYAQATNYASTWYKAWHAWALANFEVVTAITSAADRETAEISVGAIKKHVVPAIEGFFKSISLSSASSLQDALRILTLWFAHGRHQEVNNAVTRGVAEVTVDTWLDVIPQLIARINQPNKTVQNSIHELLGRVGKTHPQALVYSLTVSMKSDVKSRSSRAQTLLKQMQRHSRTLVEQATTVSEELIRIAVLWHEQWHEGLEEASRLFFGDGNIEGMLATLEPLHTLIEKGPATLREVSFIQSFGRELSEASGWCKGWKSSGDIGDINSAWDVYYQVFKRIARQLPQLMTLELQYVSPKLKEAKDLELAVPGTYRSGRPVVRIVSFDPVSTVINSKQRPRKLALQGSDGQKHHYLLKGHEDIRQDERVMQLFGLVNTLLASDPECLKRHLNIQRYSAIPLSTQSGLLGWVPNSDTIHALIKDYRDSRKILLNIEHRIMLQMAPDYDGLALMQKVEVFSYAMDNTTGQDLYRVLWLKSKSSEAWLERRTNYIRSLGVMSMVGYILGLGDRHPSNLMLDRITGKVIHIDFGDCFEVAQHRDKYPERVPFRLTRMLTFAMEVSNIEGSFRTICENVMRVLRDNKESLMAVLEAFIHDPLLTWRLTNKTDNPSQELSDRRASVMGGDANATAVTDPAKAGSLTGRPRGKSSVTGVRPPHLTQGGGPMGGTAGLPNGSMAGTANGTYTHGPPRREPDENPQDAKEVQNARALQVLARVKEKLTGTDFPSRGLPAQEVEAGQEQEEEDQGDENRSSMIEEKKGSGELGVEQQVERLITEAANLENLCQHYVGWCSFW